MAWPSVGTQNWADDLEAATDEKVAVETDRATLAELELGDLIASGVGSEGPAGPAGPQGIQGPAGQAGADSTVPGPAGADGVDGVDGAPGATGPQGADGAAGASIVFQGAWTTATAYAVDDAVSNLNVAYVCVSAHTSGAGTEPGVGASWSTVWQVMVRAIPLGGFNPWEILGNLPTTVTASGDSDSGVWTVLGALGATVTLEG